MQATAGGGGGGGGGGRRSGGGRGGRKDDGGAAVRKGPWMAEEDEVLLEYVRTHGPRDWSSIRSKGLLPRTGKSCRLRWVNKLKPDLKTGCKFSPEEERVVIELQAQFGNKWARIATYLQGRTDNDVKNFWSTRQKRLARILRTPLPARAAAKNGHGHGHGHGKPPPPPPLSPHDLQALKDPCLDLNPFEGSSSNGHCSVTGGPCEDMPMPDLTGADLLHFDTLLPPLSLAADGEASSSNAAPMVLAAAPAPLPPPPPPPFDPLPYPLLDPLPGFPESCDLGPGFADMAAMDDLGYDDPFGRAQPVPMLPFLEMEALSEAVKVEHRDAPDFFFDDLPPDMFDALEPPPPPLSPPAAGSPQL